MPSDAGTDRFDSLGNAFDAAETPAHLLALVQDAAIERALVDESDARRHLALAGSLEPARRTAADAATKRREDAPPRPAGLLGPALLAITALDALRSTDARSTLFVPDASRQLGPTADRSVVVGGASLAVRRFDADPDRAAALARVPVSTLRRRLDRSRGNSQP